MILTKDEVLDMINSTINTNGTKAITGDGLNAVLSAIVNSFDMKYYFPKGVCDLGWTLSDTYTFTEEEATKFRNAWANRANTRFILEGKIDSIFDVSAELAGVYDENTSEYWFGAGGQSFWDNIFIDLWIEDNDGELKAYRG